MRLAAFADPHLGALATGRLDPETGLPARVVDGAVCVASAVCQALDAGAQGLLVAGDVFNTPRPSPTVVRLFRQAVAPAIVAGVPVLLIPGNHDSPLSPWERHALDLVRDEPGLYVVDRPELVWLHAGSGGRVTATVGQPPAIVQVQQQGAVDICQVACLPWPNRQALLAAPEFRRLSLAQVNAAMGEQVRLVLQGLQERRTPGLPSLVLAHLTLLGPEAGRDWAGRRTGDWGLRFPDLVEGGWDISIVGHLHAHEGQAVQALHRPGCQWAVYPGSTDAVSFGEEGQAKGFLLFDLPQVTAGERPAFTFTQTPFRRYLTVDLAAGEELPGAEELAGAIVRVRVPTGDPARLAALRQTLEAAGVWEYRLDPEGAVNLRAGAEQVAAAESIADAFDEWLGLHPEHGARAAVLRELAAEIGAAQAQEDAEQCS